MSTSTVDLTGDVLAVIEDLGDTITFTGQLKNADGSNFDPTGITFTAPITSPNDAVIGSWTVNAATGTLTLTLTAATSTQIGVGTWKWSLIATTAGAPQTWINGLLTLRKRGAP